MLFPQRLGLVFYFAVAGTDCKILVDMFTKLFGPPEMLNPMDLEGPVAKKACTEAKQFEEEALHCEGGPDTSKPTILYPASHTIPISFSILSIQSTVHYAEEKVVPVVKTEIALIAIPVGISVLAWLAHGQIVAKLMMSPMAS